MTDIMVAAYHIDVEFAHVLAAVVIGAAGGVVATATVMIILDAVRRMWR